MDHVFVPCDACGHRSYVHILLDTFQELHFCAHDFREAKEALTPYELIEHRVDERKLLTDA